MTSFGNLREKRFKAYAEGSATKGIFAGGENNNGAAGYHVDYITISSAGNYTNFGIFTGYNGGDWGAAVGSDTRMWLVGGFGGSLGANMNQMVYITIASTGNTTDAGSPYNFEASKGAFGHKVMKIETVHGDCSLVKEPLFRNNASGHMCFVDLDHVSYRPLVGNGVNRDTSITTNVQQADEDLRKDLILTEAGLEVSLPETHALINLEA